MAQRPQSEDATSAAPRRRDRDWTPTLAAAVLAAAAAVLLIVVFAGVAPVERPMALRHLTASVLWIAAALIGSCSTIMALLLTTVSLLERLETRRLPSRVLFHLRLTVLGAVATIAAAVAALLGTTVPEATGGAAGAPAWRLDVVFFGLLGTTALMVGAFAVVLTSLTATIIDVLGSLPPDLVEEILDEPAADNDAGRLDLPAPD